jgi:hypothetical protein
MPGIVHHLLRGADTLAELLDRRDRATEACRVLQPRHARQGGRDGLPRCLQGGLGCPGSPRLSGGDHLIRELGAGLGQGCIHPPVEGGLAGLPSEAPGNGHLLEGGWPDPPQLLQHRALELGAQRRLLTSPGRLGCGSHSLLILGWILRGHAQVTPPDFRAAANGPMSDDQAP